jgi:hypothetical protein
MFVISYSKENVNQIKYTQNKWDSSRTLCIITTGCKEKLEIILMIELSFFIAFATNYAVLYDVNLIC